MVVKKIFGVMVIWMLILGCAASDNRKTDAAFENKAHDFTLPDQEGRQVTLSEAVKGYRGAVIAFYPKDDSRY